MENSAAVEMIRKQLENKTVDLPVFHPVALKLQKMLANYDFTVEEVAKVAGDDQSLAGQMVRMANSAFYAGQNKVATIRDAVIRLGAQQVSNLAMAVTQSQSHRSADPLISRLMADLWKHSHGCAVGCRWLAENTGFRGIANEVYLAGLLHDVGKLYVLKVIEEMMKGGARFSEDNILEALDALHVEEGARLMERWNFTDILIEVAREHHGDEWDRDSDAIAIVRLVNQACRKVGIGLNSDPSIALMSMEEAQILDVKEIDIAELEVVLEDSSELDI